MLVDDDDDDEVGGVMDEVDFGLDITAVDTTIGFEDGLFIRKN